MPHSIEWLPDDSLIIVSITNPLDVRADPWSIVEGVAEIQRDFHDELYLIIDASTLEASFTQVVFMLANTFVGKMPEGLNRDKLHRILVSTHKLAQFWVEGSSQSQYGGYKYQIATSREDAIQMVRSTIDNTMEQVG